MKNQNNIQVLVHGPEFSTVAVAMKEADEFNKRGSERERGEEVEMAFIEESVEEVINEMNGKRIRQRWI